MGSGSEYYTSEGGQVWAGGVAMSFLALPSAMNVLPLHPMSTLTLDQLKRAVTISEQIEKLQKELAGILGSHSAPVAKPASAPVKTGKFKRSPATIAKMKASQQARWAKIKGKKTAATSKAPAEAKAETLAKKKRTMSPEAKAKIGAAMRKRWADAKAGKGRLLPLQRRSSQFSGVTRGEQDDCRLIQGRSIFITKAWRPGGVSPVL